MALGARDREAAAREDLASTTRAHMVALAQVDALAAQQEELLRQVRDMRRMHAMPVCVCVYKIWSLRIVTPPACKFLLLLLLSLSLCVCTFVTCSCVRSV